MNKILFRGKPTKEAMGEEPSYAYETFPVKDGFVYGHLITGAQPYIVGPIEEVNNEYCSMEWWCPVIPETIGQFTGLTDKNGKKIFEGDICRVLLKGEQFGDLLEIRFLHGAFCTGPVGYDDESFDPLKGVCEEYESHGLQLEAIGTIYDNPELLEGKES